MTYTCTYKYFVLELFCIRPIIINLGQCRNENINDNNHKVTHLLAADNQNTATIL